ncbi:MAG: magnesium transporter CorA family protein [bacterium]|nr:magnesium transporter CorA family protein [bacterium]
MLKRYKLFEDKIMEATDENSTILLFTDPDENDRKHLVENYGLDEHTLNSALDPDEISRLEIDQECTTVIFKRPKNFSKKDTLLFGVTTTGIFLFKEKLIILNSEDVELFEGKHFAKVSSLTEVIIKLIYGSVYHFLGHLKAINMFSDELQEKINLSMENKYLINLFALEKSLVYYLNAINSNSVLIEKLKNSYTKIDLSKEQLEYLDDIYVENSQCYKQAEIYSNILASLMDARASVISNNLNVSMKTLTIITICIMVPTLVVSCFSMNVKIPFQQHPRAFWIIMGIALAALFGFLFLWHRRKLK